MDVTPATSSAFVSEALCPEHPSQTSTDTCHRCGRFVCAECSLLEGACRECQLRVLRELPSGDGRARWAQWTLGTCGVGFAFTLLLQVWLYSRLEAWGMAGAAGPAAEGIARRTLLDH